MVFYPFIPSLTIKKTCFYNRTANQISRQPANCDEGGLILTLADGVLKDQASRTGYMSANYQLQFDDPPQSGALVGDGFAVCPDGNLSLKGNATFYECPTSDDAWNLYDRSWAEHCGAVRLIAKRCGGAGEVVESVGGGETAVVPTKVITEMEDGQPRVKSTEVGKVVCQIEDGEYLFSYAVWFQGIRANQDE